MPLDVMPTAVGELRYPIEEQNDYLGTIRFTPEYTTNGARQIELYLPASIQFGDTVQIENANLGATFNSELVQNIIGRAQGSQGPHGDNKPFGIGDISAALEAGAGDASLGEVVLLQVAKMSDKAGKFIRAATKQSPNPNTRALFKQVNLRQFQFTFKMIPKSELEARTIGGIITSFRRNMYPEDIVKRGFPIGYKFPCRYKIEVFYDGKDMTHAYNIKTEYSFLSTVMTNYNPSGMAFMKGVDGKPYFSEIDMSLTFMEGKTLSQASIEEGF